MLAESDRYLIVAAHPDDEVLMCGGSVGNWINGGASVNSCILVGGAHARTQRPEDTKLRANIRAAHERLNIHSLALGDFPNIKLNTVPHLDIVQFIERSIENTGANVIVTHHPADVNDDHRHTAQAAQAAMRLFQRRSNIPAMRRLMYAEVLSATDWTVQGALNQFTPNCFVEIGEEGVAAKIAALNCYDDVTRPYPHPRSRESLKALATYRGSCAGLEYAEAFQIAFERNAQ